MAVTEVIRFDFFAQAVNGIRSGILRPTFLFEHSPPIVELPRPLSPFDGPSIQPGYVCPGYRANCSIARANGGRKGRFQCRRPICTKQFYLSTEG